MKKLLSILFVSFIVFGCFFSFNKTSNVYAKEAQSQENIEEKLNSTLSDTISEFDFSALDKFLISLTENEKVFFNANDFVSKIKQIVSGEFANGFDTLGKAILNLFFDNLLNLVPIFAIIVAIGIVSSLFNTVSSKTKGVGDVIHLMCFGIIATIVVKYICDFIAITHAILLAINSISDCIFPILLTIVASMGGIVSVNVYQPAVLVFCNYIIKLFSTVLISLFIFAFIFQMVSCFSSKLKFKKFSEFFASTFKWILGLVFFLFMTYLALQGITSSMFDGMKIRTAKFAVRSYVPLLGGYLSEGFDFILSSLMLVKNAVGVAGILLLLSCVIAPILKMIVFGLGLKLVGAICEPICDERITNFITSVGKLISLLIVLIVGASFMFLIISGLIVLTINLV